MEERAHAVVLEGREAEGAALDALDEIVGRLRGTMRGPRLVPGNDLVVPARQRPSERAHLDGTGGLGHLASQFVDPLGSELWVGIGAELVDRPLRVARCGDLTVATANAQSTTIFASPVSSRRLAAMVSSRWIR